MKQKIIQQGAEANIILFKGSKEKSFIIKDRIKKGYRLPELDIKIRGKRTKSEAKLLEKASKVIHCPIPFLQPSIKNSSKLKMPFIDGKKLSEHLDKFPLKKQKEICKKIGESVGKIHNLDIIHGDLTTSNMILKNDQVYLIDFGLGFISHKYEDKAVDLHLLKQALEAKHFKNWKELLNQVIKEYQKYKDSGIILERLMAVEKRGRYKK